MCGRFTLRTGAKQLANLFEDVKFPEIEPRYNIAPTQPVLCLRESFSGELEAVLLRWGLVPSWSKDLKIGSQMINARSETVATKPSFRAAFRQRRCVILADGFYEWKKLPDGKQPYYIYCGSRNEPFCFAGLWESWRNPNAKTNEASTTTEGRSVETCAIMTTTANATMEGLHDRMPVILSRDACDVWLDRDVTDRERLESLLLPCPADWLAMYPVSRSVNKPTYDQADCLAPADLSIG